MPKAILHYVHIEIPKAEKKTAGGIYLPEKSIQQDFEACDNGTIVDMGPDCWKFKSRDSTIPFKIGDKAYFARYGGRKIPLKSGGMIRVLADEDIVAKMTPDDMIEDIL